MKQNKTYGQKVFKKLAEQNNQPATPSPSNTEQVEGFTPGEWQIRNYPEYIIIHNNGNEIARLYLPDSDRYFKLPLYPVKEAEANAALIASAPQLKAENNRLKADNKVLLEALAKMIGAVALCRPLTIPDDHNGESKKLVNKITAECMVIAESFLPDKALNQQTNNQIK